MLFQVFDTQTPLGREEELSVPGNILMARIIQFDVYKNTAYRF